MKGIAQSKPRAPYVVHGLRAGRPERLPERTWQAFLWRYGDGLTFVEIGRRLERTPQRVRELCLRAERACEARYRRHLAAEWGSGY